MAENIDNRNNIRIDHISLMHIKNLRSGEIYEARMFNYSYGGIYFESDIFLAKNAPVYISIQHSPYSAKSGVLEYYKGEVRWRNCLKQSLFKYGYGIQWFSDEIAQRLKQSAAGNIEELRKHPRKPFTRSVKFGTRGVISQGTTKNISPSGVFIATEAKFEVGQILKLKLALKAGRNSKITGKIVWSNAEGFGLKFLKIN